METENKTSLPTKLVFLRKQKGLTQMELAEKLNVSRQAISRWEVGAAVPSTDNLKVLGDLYEVPVDYLLNDELDNISKPKEETQEQISNEQKKGVFVPRRIVFISIAVVLVLLAVIISSVIVPNQNKEDIVPMEDMTALEENDFSTVVLPIK